MHTRGEIQPRCFLSAQNKTLIFPLPANVPSKLLRPIFEKVPNMSDKEMYPQVLKDKRSSWSKVPSYLRTNEGTFEGTVRISVHVIN